MERRGSYEFSREARLWARKEADGACQFPAEDCGNSNTGRVNHITGVGISRRDALDVDSITDPRQNAIMLCQEHQDDLDRQEAYQLACLIYDRRSEAA